MIAKKKELKDLAVKCNSLLHQSLYQEQKEINLDLILKIASMSS